MGGILSGDPAINPDFYDWSKARVQYCDGASFSGDVSEPQKTNDGKLLFFRGRRILDAVLASLLQRGLNSSTHLILSGSSAGGLATYIHSDYIKRKLPASVDVVALADAGLFVDVPQWTGLPGIAHSMYSVVREQNVSALNEGCSEHHSGDERWHCFMAPYTLPYIKTPLFLVQGLHDRVQAELIGADCSLSCPDATQYNAWLNLPAQIKSALRKAPNGSGIFAHPCIEHTTVTWDSFWTGRTIDGVALRDAFSHWWSTRGSMTLIGEGNPSSGDCGPMWTESFEEFGHV